VPRSRGKTPIRPTIYVQLLQRDMQTGKPRFVKGSTITVLQMSARQVYGVINEALRQEACRLRDEMHRQEDDHDDNSEPASGTV